MKKLYIGIKMDLKLLFAHYKRLLLFAMQMIILCIAIGVTGSHILYADHSVEPFSLAIVDEENSKWTKMIIGTINQMKTVTGLCKIQVLDKQIAKETLEKGEVTAIVTIPDNFVEDVMTGVNTPITLEKRDGTLLEAVVADQLINAGAKLLSAAQVGIYTTLDAYEAFGLDQNKSYDSLLQEVNIIFAKEMLDRNSMFEEKEVVATKLVSPLEHYILSGYIVMMLLSLMLVMDSIGILNKQENLMRFSIAKVKIRTIVTQKLISLSLFMLLLSMTILGSIATLSAGIGLKMDWQLSFQGMLGILLVAISLSSLGLLIGLIFSKIEAYSLFVFLVAVVMAFLSGGIIPSAYLSESINRLGAFTYNSFELKLLMPLMGVNCELVTYFNMLLLTIMCLGISGILLKKRGLEV